MVALCVVQPHGPEPEQARVGLHAPGPRPFAKGGRPEAAPRAVLRNPSCETLLAARLVGSSPPPARFSLPFRRPHVSR
eukprot:11033780-Lingulodinium_polyedra.AAC.1